MANLDSIYCPACRQRTSVERRAQWAGPDGFHYEIGECNSCQQRFLVKRNGTRAIVEIHPNALPRPIDDSIPSPIKEDMEEASKCLAAGAWRATVVMARRAIQNICLEKGAPRTREITTKEGDQTTVNNSLVNQIDWLYDQRIITKDLKGWAHEIRTVGNEGAHPGEAEDIHPVTQQDAIDVLDLADAFCGPLYIAAAIYSKRKKVTD